MATLKHKESEQISTRLSPKEAQEIDRLVDLGFYINSADFLRQAVREKREAIEVVELRKVAPKKARQEVLVYLQKHGRSYASDGGFSQPPRALPHREGNPCQKRSPQPLAFAVQPRTAASLPRATPHRLPIAARSRRPTAPCGSGPGRRNRKAVATPRAYLLDVLGGRSPSMPSAFPAGARDPRVGICGETDYARRFSGRRTLITGWMKAFGSLLLAVRGTLVDLARCSAEVVAIGRLLSLGATP